MTLRISIPAGAASTLCHRAVCDVFWHELRPSASLPLQADSHSRSSFVPSRVIQSHVIRSTRASRVHCRREQTSERASERAERALYPFENYCLQISVYCAPWDGQEFRQIVYLSALSPGIRGTLSLAAGSPFARLRAERYLLQQNQYFECLIWIRRAAGSQEKFPERFAN